jgi:hypothetical protein
MSAAAKPTTKEFRCHCSRLLFEASEPYPLLFKTVCQSCKCVVEIRNGEQSTVSICKRPRRF